MLGIYWTDRGGKPCYGPFVELRWRASRRREAERDGNAPIIKYKIPNAKSGWIGSSGSVRDSGKGREKRCQGSRGEAWFYAEMHACRSGARTFSRVEGAFVVCNGGPNA